MEVTEEPTKTAVSCHTCGESVFTEGAYSVQIKPPRSKLPKKAQKMLKKSEPLDPALSSSKFHKYLIKRCLSNAHNRQTVKVKCGHCRTVTDFQAQKPTRTAKQTMIPGTSTPQSVPGFHPLSSVGSSQYRKKKRTKEINAGLNIPTSFTPSPYSYQNRPGPTNAAQTPKPSKTSRPPVSKNQMQRNLNFVSAALASTRKTEGGSGLEKFLND